MPIPRAPRAPWKALVLLAVAFLLLGAEGEGNATTVVAMLGAVLSIGGAGIGYGLTKAQADIAKERADQAHSRIGTLETGVAESFKAFEHGVGGDVKRLTQQFMEFRLELAESGVMRAQPRSREDGR